VEGAYLAQGRILDAENSGRISRVIGCLASHIVSTENWCLLNHGAISLHVAMVFIASCFIAAISLVVLVACIFLLVSYD
jgi:uncharacterized membrane protein HdeD (DUF308 family)